MHFRRLLGHRSAGTRRLVAAALGGALVATLALAAPMTAAAAPPPPDGRTEATAAASCYEIKRNTPSAPSGIYWLWTPRLLAPEQFYCDQTTDGGGWVLVGRGRDWWSGSDEGMGTPAQVRDVITGTGAFQPRQLSVATITGLLNGTSVTALRDGVRLRRALNTSGSSWQEVRFKFSSPRDEWTWQFASAQRVGSWQIGSARGTGGETANFGSGSATNRVDTRIDNTRGWRNGFGYGADARGNPDSSSYVWASTTSAGYPRPFTQVFLRPELLSSNVFTTIPDGGTAAVQNRAVASSLPQTPRWGVTGLGAAGTGIQNTEVSAFAEAHGRVYVGGNFRYVQRDSAGTGRVEQSYLAAFDVNTGEWVSTFRPSFNNQVKALAVLPDGRLAVGGEFTRVNGANVQAFTVLDPSTGTTSSSFSTRVINYTDGAPPRVRSLDVQDGYLYIAGAFTHLGGGSSSGETYARMLGRVSLSNGTPDSWSPRLNGTVISIDASGRGDRVYAAGYFDQGSTARRAGAFLTTDASIVPWTVDFSNLNDGRIGYQQAVKEVGDRVWLGGSEHMLFSYARTDMSEVSTNITSYNGDFQAINVDGNNNVYAGCHCGQSNYEGARKWPNVGTSWIRQAKIDQTGVWDARSGRYVSDFSPVFTNREGAGTWALMTDSTGVTWMGGDFTHARRDTITNMWTGGFVRFATRDATAPSVPGPLSVSTVNNQDVVSWGPSTDAGGTVLYHVLRANRVVATTASTSIALPAAEAGTKYFVRAADSSRNVSASTGAVVSGGSTGPAPAPEPEPEPQPSDGVLIDSGSTWSYYFGSEAPAAGWQAPSFTAAGWSSGSAVLGWGHSELGTTLTAPDPRPLTSYYRRSVEVADASQVSSVTITTRIDDGVVVYVNGTEVGRANMPAGPVGHGTYASTAVSASDATTRLATFTASGALFRTGTNVIAAEVHSNYRSTPSHSFDMLAQVNRGAQPAPAPSETVFVNAGSTWSYYFGSEAPASGWQAPSFTAAGWSSGSAVLGWGHSELGTTLTAPDPRPLTSYYRRSFEVADASRVSSVTVTTRADDVVVVYVNGTEVGRANMPAGPVGHGTYASSAVSASNAVATPVTFTVPGALLRTGTNVITAEVHSNYRSTASHSFELRASTGG